MGEKNRHGTGEGKKGRLCLCRERSNREKLHRILSNIERRLKVDIKNAVCFGDFFARQCNGL